MLHALGVLLAVLCARAVHQDPVARPAERVEFDLTAPPPPAPVPPAPVPPTPAPPVPVPPTALVHRVTVPGPHPPVTPTPVVAQTGPDTATGTVEPAPTPAPPAQTAPSGPAPQPLTAAGLMHAADDLAVSTAALLPPGHVDRPSRDIYNGSPRQTLQQIAAGPTLAMLAETQHMLPAGATVHDRAMARRAAESFIPTRTVAGIGDAVRRAPTVSLAPIQRDTARDRAAGDAMDSAHDQSFTMLTFGGGNTRSYHLVRAEVEVDQSPTGAVTATRVVRQSGVAGFDDAAVRAIREAVDEVTPLNPATGGRRTRWAFEVSDSDGVGSRLLGNGDEGWTPLADAVQGMRLRMRVRRIGSQRL